jgi:hypothetical protein
MSELSVTDFRNRARAWLEQHAPRRADGGGPGERDALFGGPGEQLDRLTAQLASASG